MKNMIVEELRNRGYKAELVERNKNGVIKTGVMIDNGTNAKPVIYINGCEERTLEANVLDVLMAFNKAEKIDINLEELLSREFLQEHLTVSLRRDCEDDAIKGFTDFEGIESYLELAWDDKRVKINEAVLEVAGVIEWDAWEMAMNNLERDSILMSMEEIYEEAEELGYNNIPEAALYVPMSVITNKSRVKGASAILVDRLIEEYAKSQDVDKVIFIPSTIHEGILIPYGEVPVEVVNERINEVNKTVLPEEILGKRAYIIEV